MAQNSKGGTFASNFSASNQVIGVKKTGDLLEKLTWVFGVGLLVLCLVINLLAGTPGGQQERGTPATRSAMEHQAPQMALPEQGNNANNSTTPATNTPTPATDKK